MPLSVIRIGRIIYVDQTTVNRPDWLLLTNAIRLFCLFHFDANVLKCFFFYKSIYSVGYLVRYFQVLSDKCDYLKWREI